MKEVESHVNKNIEFILKNYGNFVQIHKHGLSYQLFNAVKDFKINLERYDSFLALLVFNNLPYENEYIIRSMMLHRHWDGRPDEDSIKRLRDVEWKVNDETHSFEELETHNDLMNLRKDIFFDIDMFIGNLRNHIDGEKLRYGHITSTQELLNIRENIINEFEYIIQDINKPLFTNKPVEKYDYIFNDSLDEYLYRLRDRLFKKIALDILISQR